MSEKKECLVCDWTMAGVGLIVGMVFLYISIDVLSKGALTKALMRGGTDDTSDL